MKLKIFRYAKHIVMLSVLSYTVSCTDDGFQAFEAPQGNVNGVQPSTIFTVGNPEGTSIYNLRSFSTDANSYKWDFGDGNSSTEADIDYTYEVGGVYTLKLETTSVDGLVASDSIQVAPVVTSFDLIKVDNQVTFTNTTTGAESYLWDFGDGNTSEEENPTHGYEQLGDYTITLTATGFKPLDFTSDPEEPEFFDASIVSTNAQVSVLNLASAPNFTTESNGLEITFIDSSLLAESYLWDFGDGSPTVTTQSPVHTYDIDGSYEVTLTTKNDIGTETSITKTVDVGAVAITIGQYASITDTSAADTGELRLDLGSSGVIVKGKVSVNVSKTVSGSDAFVALYGSSTSGSNAMIDMRLGDDPDENFSMRNEAPADANPPAFINDQIYTIEIEWDATGTTAPLLTVTIDGELLTAAPFASGGNLSDIVNGVRNLQFRFGGSSAITPDSEGMLVDNIKIFDTSSGAEILVFEDDFEDSTVGNSLDPDADDPTVAGYEPGAVIEPGTPYRNNSFQAIVAEE